MINKDIPGESIADTEDAMPEELKQIISARVFRELTETDEEGNYENKNRPRS